MGHFELNVADVADETPGQRERGHSDEIRASARDDIVERVL